MVSNVCFFKEGGRRKALVVWFFKSTFIYQVTIEHVEIAILLFLSSVYASYDSKFMMLSTTSIASPDVEIFNVSFGFTFFFGLPYSNHCIPGATPREEEIPASTANA